MISAHSVSSLLAKIFGPAIYDLPRFGCGNLGGRRDIFALASGPQPDPWREVALTPQPLPPGERRALALADANLQEVFALDRAGALLGEEAGRRGQDRALHLIAQIEELCPRWPLWPKSWPLPPPPPPWERDQVMPTELFLFGTRVLAASQEFDQGRLQDALAGLGEKALSLSMNR